MWGNKIWLSKQRERKNRENGRYGNWGQLSSAGVVEPHMQPKGTYCFSHYYNWVGNTIPCQLAAHKELRQLQSLWESQRHHVKLNAHLSHLTLVGQGTSGIKEDLTVSGRYTDLNVVILPMLLQPSSILAFKLQVACESNALSKPYLPTPAPHMHTHECTHTNYHRCWVWKM